MQACAGEFDRETPGMEIAFFYSTGFLCTQVLSGVGEWAHITITWPFFHTIFPFPLLFLLTLC